MHSESAVFPALHRSCFSFPAIDNHAHPLLSAEHRDHFPFENLISEAEGDSLLDSVHTLACMRAVPQLGSILKIENPSWDAIKDARAQMPYLELCKLFMRPTGIQCIFLDDGLGGVEDFAENLAWHDQFTNSPTRRIVRVEIVAESILKSLLTSHLGSAVVDTARLLDNFNIALRDSITSSATDSNVVGFKSIACYRTGLDVSPSVQSDEDIKMCLRDVSEIYREKGTIRLAHKALNDHVVQVALEIAGVHKKPVQFHTGLGDNDITLTRSSSSHLQPIIKAFPDTSFVLLHSSYPFTREAGYLSAVYSNVFLDFGEVFPFVSGGGQRAIVRQVLELCPMNRIMWSTDGHWWPESYYLGTVQAREALYTVLAEIVTSGELKETEAATIAENALFHNANKLYNLGLEPERPVFE
ncbi:amidohydrolase-domain-containing protein [Mycena sp. CBHHK59/15]|nr:amidohydrolase-domain-containing protein [Mycena sp. CBHHK59/15]